MRKIPNKFKCQKALWNKFSDRGKVAYNNMRGYTQSDIFPNADINPKIWDVISHNFACNSAWEFDLPRS